MVCASTFEEYNGTTVELPANASGLWKRQIRRVSHNVNCFIAVLGAEMKINLIINILDFSALPPLERKVNVTFCSISTGE